MSGWSGHAWPERCFWCLEVIPAEKWHWHHNGIGPRGSGDDDVEIAIHEGCLRKMQEQIDRDLEDAL